MQQRDDDALLRSLMATVPGAIYRSAWHAGHRLELITDEIERISGYPADNFIASARRTLISIVHPDDRDRVLGAVATVTDHEHPFVLEYRIVRADGELRWVLDRGQLVPGAGGRLWMDGAIFDITERRMAEEALRRREIEAARTEELRASRVRIVAAADAARRRIERDLHDGAQQRLVAMALDVRMMRARAEREPAELGAFLDRLGDELAAASSELRELARGIHPAVLTERGLGAAIEGLANRAPVPVEVGGAAGRPAPADGRDDGVLHRRRGADQRGQVRLRDARRGARGAGGRPPRGRGARRRRRRGGGEHRLGPRRPVGPRGRDRRHAQRHQPAGRGHARARRAAAVLTHQGPSRNSRPEGPTVTDDH